MRPQRWLLPAFVAAAVLLSVQPGPLRPRYQARFQPERPKQGQTVRLVLDGVPAWLPVDCVFRGRRLPVDLLAGGERRILLPIAGDAVEASSLSLSVPGLTGWAWKLTLPVDPGDFPSQTIQLSKDVYSLFEDSAVAKANAMLRRSFEAYTPDQYWSGEFGWPIDGRETTPFGARRVMQGEIHYFHKGIDLAAKKGTVVKAANAGVVRVADHLPLQGNVVVLDHGFGVETVYQHMSELLVKPGERVAKGQPVGRVGSTGISTGPHLHWSLFVHGVPVDPADWTRRSF